MEVRKDSHGTWVEGYFCTWLTLSHDMGFRERVLKGAFTESLKTTPVRCLFNHTDGCLLGRTESQTLFVEQDATGLHFRVNLPPTTYANDLVVLLERKDAFECSWGFLIPDGGDEWTSMADGTLLRTISKATIFEGSILVSPAAYPNTSASLRSLPKSLRSKLKNKRDSDDEDKNTDECQCQCASCLAGDHDDCTGDPECGFDNDTEDDNNEDDKDDNNERSIAAHLQLLRLRIS
jgi:HK97 family phage prohead protease